MKLSIFACTFNIQILEFQLKVATLDSSRSTPYFPHIIQIVFKCLTLLPVNYKIKWTNSLN